MVVPGTGTNDSAASIAATRRASALGADAALVVTPYYNRPTQAMLVAHYTAIADDGGLPIVVYNVPSRTACNVDAESLLRLADHPRIVGVKEASGNLDQIARICAERPAGFAVLSGDDAWTLPILALGGDGVVSVASNELPAQVAALCAAAAGGDWDRARRIHEQLLPLFRANFAGAPNPAPVKAALAAMGLIENRLRLPLLAMETPGGERMTDALRAAGWLDARTLAPA
jgi:4-hydroxy-tetrahydrodipicolinate synthase